MKMSSQVQCAVVTVVFLFHISGQTSSDPQYAPGGQIPPYGVHNPGPGQNGYRDNPNGYHRDPNQFPNRDPNAYNSRDGQNRYNDGQSGYRDGQDRYRDGQNGYRDGQNGYRDGQNGYRDGQNGYRDNPGGYRDGQDIFRDGQDGVSISRRLGDHVARIAGPELRALLDRVDVMLSHQCTKNVATQWEFETNVNPGTQQAALIAQLEYADYQRAVWDVLNNVTREQYQDGPIWRQIQYLSVIGPAALPPELLDRYNKLIYDMLAVFNGATTCAYNEPFKCGLRLEPELTVVMGRSRDWDELQHQWLEWRRLTGQKIRDLFEQVVDLTNKAAQLNHFKDGAEYWMFPYESPNFRYELDEVWEEVRPLYELLHAYVRRKLRDLYGPDKLSRKAPLPAHILGFHEAVGEAVALSISTPRHLQDLGLVQGSVDDTPHNINMLYALALDKLPFLGFSLALDQWRWDIFEGSVSQDQYNCHWWRLREKYSGVKPPVLRSEIDFDPGSKYHVAANMPYIR
ncbi:hypothetical protein C0J52_24081 [Blattella germanica]|nr:hypothetical protein C0J52_24081 [Blattella germanica]